MTSGVYFMLSYTFAHAIDDGQDALVAGRPATVQNSYAPNAEKGPSVTDQRHRFVFSCVVAPKPFHRDHEWLGRLFNNWKASGVVTIGSGRPVSATVTGDANQDGNNSNDRLPGVSPRLIGWARLRHHRLATYSPISDWRSHEIGTDRRIFQPVESRQSAGTDHPGWFHHQFGTVRAKPLTLIGINYFPAQYRVPTSFLRATDAYAPRQIQLALKLIY